jgi:hypothetical protein
MRLRYLTFTECKIRGLVYRKQNIKSRAPTDPQEDHLKDGERAVRPRQKRTDTDKQQDRVLKEKKKNVK